MEHPAEARAAARIKKLSDPWEWWTLETVRSLHYHRPELPQLPLAVHLEFQLAHGPGHKKSSLVYKATLGESQPCGRIFMGPNDFSRGKQQRIVFGMTRFASA